MTTPVEPIDALDHDRHEAAHRTLHDAEQYLNRITEQYGPDHDETRYATFLADDARAAHESTNCHWAFLSHTPTATAVPEAITNTINNVIDAVTHASDIPADLFHAGTAR